MEKDIQATNEAALVARFRKNVLTWDYLRIFEESNVGLLPFFPSFLFLGFPTFFVFVLQMSNDAKKKKAIAIGIKTVKNTYKNMEEYLGVFEPLLFEEIKSQINQSKGDFFFFFF